ncbi:MAG TPA: 2-oxoglutarate dehydrogenase, E2 component, dihydrolipoamide succinyltransferase, partial [Dermatophilaceae bacterium]
VPVGADLAVIGEGATAPSESAAPAAEPPTEQAQPVTEQAQPVTEQAQPPTEQAQPVTEQAQPVMEQEAPAAEQGEPAAEPAPAAVAPAAAVEAPETPAAAAPAVPDEVVSGGTAVRMPALGESVTEGTVTRWLKAEGDQIAVDEPLLEVSTDKVDTEIPSPLAGTITKILVGEDETVPVGADLAIIGGQAAVAQAAPEQPSAPAPAPVAPAPVAPEHPAPEPAAAAPSTPAPATDDPAAAASAVPSSGGSEAAAYVTPLVRKLASDNDVDLATLKGTGVGGRIRKQDVLDAAAAAKAAAAPIPSAPAPASMTPAAPAGVTSKRGTTEKMSRLRKVIAARMVESLHISAQLTTVVEVDVTKIARLRDKAKRDFETREGIKLTFLPFFAVAAVEALKAHPSVNSSVEGDEITYHGSENLGVAVDTDRGLLVPVIKDAGDLNIAGLSRKIADLAERTRTSNVSPDELGGGTFTLTNTGSRGALFDTPIINQPNVAILGTGAVVKRPVVVKDNDGGETIAIHSMVYLALSYDHRVVDGAEASRFLNTIKGRLEEGAFEASLGL